MRNFVTRKAYSWHSDETAAMQASDENEPQRPAHAASASAAALALALPRALSLSPLSSAWRISREEVIDLPALRWIIANYESVRHHFHEDSSLEDHQATSDDLLVQLKRLQKACNADGIVKVTYQRSHDRPWGRFFAKSPALQSLCHVVRHTLARDLYHDVDMVNAAPSILVQLCAMHGVACPAINDYVARRDACLQELIGTGLTRSDAKKVILSILNGGRADYNNLARRPDWLVRLFKECRTIAARISAFYPEELAFRRGIKKDNCEASTVTTVVFEIECRCLMAAVDFLESRGFRPDALVFDGLMVRKDHETSALNQSVLSDMSRAVERATGFAIQFDIKPMDQGLELPEDYVESGGIIMALPPDLVITMRDYDMAMLVKHLLGGTHVCVCKRRENTWYTFDGGRWKEDRGAYDLKLKMSTEVFDFCMKCSEDPFCTSDMQEIFLGIAHAMKTTPCKDRIARECAAIMYDPNLLNRLDENKYLLGFDNGVLDLQRLEFREAVLEDYISMSCGYDWVDEDDPEIRADILGFIRSIQNDDDVSEYILKTLAYMLAGNRYLENFWIWTGRGANGKGTLTNLLEATFGQYMYAPSSTVFTTKKSTCFNPELTKTKGKRLLASSEPADDSHKLQVSDIKNWTGNDTIQSRTLHKEPIEFRPQFGIILQCNDIPELSKVDGGIVRRLYVVKFPYIFTKNPVNAEDKVMDMGLKSRLENRRYAQQFVRILFEYYVQYVHGGQDIEPPTAVLEATGHYLAETNTVGDWLAEFYDRTDDTKDRIYKPDLYAAFLEANEDNNMTAAVFYKQVKSLGGFQDIKSTGRWYFTGIVRK